MRNDPFRWALCNLDHVTSTVAIKLEGQQVDCGLAGSAEMREGSFEALASKPGKDAGFEFSFHVCSGAAHVCPSSLLHGIDSLIRHAWL
jgi:hypothetical protein